MKQYHYPPLSEQEHVAILNALNATIKMVGADQGTELLLVLTSTLTKLNTIQGDEVDTPTISEEILKQAE
jgi:hypothetical protein